MWRERIRPHRGELKNLLKDQSFVAGIGNGYADEILWEARLAPLRKRSSLAVDEVDALYAAVRTVPGWAIAELRRRVPPSSRWRCATSSGYIARAALPVRAAAPPSARSHPVAS